MFTARNKGRFALIAAAVGVSLALSGCANADPLSTGSASGGSDTTSDTIVVGSQAYYSNEIIAEIYAQALENAGITVKRQFQIGQRDAYIPAMESGEVDLIPEYTGNLLQFYSPDTTVTKSEDVFTELQAALPAELKVLDQSSATDQDSYNVTADFAAANNLKSLADLANVTEPLTLGGAPELEDRPYGPKGLKSLYGVTVAFKATGDTTVDALVAGTINIANVYSADPSIGANNFVTLADPDGMFLASNVVPLVNAKKADALAPILNPISAALTPEGLVALNVLSTVQKQSSAQIATDWLTKNGLLN